MKTTFLSPTIAILAFSLSLMLISCGSDDNEASIEDNSNESSFQVANFTPNKGLEGTEITINGNDFGTNAQNVEITVNDIPATITEFSNTRIKVAAPKNDRGVAAQLKVKINSSTQTLSPTFLYPGPRIDDFYPKIGVLFRDITIKGSYFSDDPNEIKVSINNRDLPIISSSTDSIVFQTNNPGFLLEQFPISVEIDGQAATTVDNYTYGLQYQVNNDLVNNNLNNGVPICPGSAVNLNINDNRNTDSNISISSNVMPSFLFNDVEAPILFTWPANNKGRDFFLDVPTSLDIGTATIKSKLGDIDLFAAQSDQIEIGEGTFKLKSNSILSHQNIQIELSHIFRKPKEMIVEFKNIADNSVLMGTVTGDSFSDDLTKTTIGVSNFGIPGTYIVSVFTPDHVYELKPLGDPQLLLTN